jgi:hypothetical protein
VTCLTVFLKNRLDVFVEADGRGVCGQRDTSPDAAHEYCRPKDPGNHLASFNEKAHDTAASQSSASRREKMCPQSSQRRWINGGVPDCPTIRVCRPPHFVQTCGGGG